MADEKVEVLTAKVDKLAKSMTTFTTVVCGLQRGSPQNLPPLTRRTTRGTQAGAHPIKDNKVRVVVENLQQQQETQLLPYVVGIQVRDDLNQKFLDKEETSCKMNISNNNVKLVRSHLNHKQKRKFVPLGMNLEKVFCILEVKGVLKPLQPKFPNFIQNGGGYCKYHQVNGHYQRMRGFQECGAFKNAVQDLVDQDKIDPTEFDHRAAAASMPVTS